MTRYRCYYPFCIKAPTEIGAGIVLNKEESHHLLSVLRVKCGELVSVFDGQGGEWMCTYDSAQHGLALLKIEKYNKTQKPKRQITLIQAMPKGKVMDQIIRQATEIGISRIIPLKTERTELKLDEVRSRRRVERWKQVTIEASKQANNSFLPIISPISSIKDALVGMDDSLKLVASLQPGAQSVSTYMDKALGGNIICCVGPEGDFSAAEYQLLDDAQFLPLRLTKNILRSETAALYTLSLLDVL